MTAYPVPRPEDVYDAETVAGFRSAGYWRDDTLSASVDRLAEQDRVLLTDGYGALTAAQLREQAYRLAAALRRLGVEAGDRVQVQLPNWNEFVVVYVALARIGAVLVPTMPIYRHDEVLYVLRHSGAKVSVVAGEFRGFDYPDMMRRSARRRPNSSTSSASGAAIGRACSGSPISSPAPGCRTPACSASRRRPTRRTASSTPQAPSRGPRAACTP